MQLSPKGPFPFKGKGEPGDWRLKTLRHQFDQSREALTEIERTMLNLVDQFEQTFTSPIAAYLVLHKTGSSKYLRWRMWGSQQSYFSVCQNERGAQFLASLSAPVRQVVLDYEQQRIRLNLLHGVYQYETKSLQRFVTDQRDLNKLIRQTTN